jgi:phosphoglycerol transferase MdoB-like AlkP superfamily enzyme
MADEMSSVNGPFFTTLFTLSSHHPYSIPAQYSGKFKPGSLPIHISIRYADYALKKFFEYAEQQKWYSNTLFVITADHTALTEKQFYMNRQGMYAIPLLFFSPSDTLIRKEIKTTQQIDILPSVLSYLNYDEDYFAYGQSIFDSTRTGFAINYLNDSYQWIEDNHAFILNDGTQNEFYQFEDVSENSLLTRSDSAAIHLKLNAFLQQFTSSLIHNKMTVH